MIVNTADPTNVPKQSYKKNPSKRLTIALLLILGPTVLIALTFIITALINWTNVPNTLPAACSERLSSSLMAEDTSCPEQLFGEQPAAQTGINVLLFILGAIGVAAWLPGIIIGVVLLTKRPKSSSNSTL